MIILLPLVANHKKTLNPKSDFAADIAPLTKFTVLLRIKRKSLFHYRYKPQCLIARADPDKSVSHYYFMINFLSDFLCLLFLPMLPAGFFLHCSQGGIESVLKDQGSFEYRGLYGVCFHIQTLPAFQKWVRDAGNHFHNSCVVIS